MAVYIFNSTFFDRNKLFVTGSNNATLRKYRFDKWIWTKI